MKIDENWRLIYHSIDNFEAKLILAKLKEHKIECILFNHQDSEFPNLNLKLQTGVYVHENDFEEAKKLIIK